MEEYEDILLCDGLEDAFLGVCHRFGQPPVAAYSVEKIIEVYMNRDGMTYEEAVEFYEFNVVGAWVGDRTPVFVSQMALNDLDSLISKNEAT